MELIERIESLNQWGEKLQNIPNTDIKKLFEKATSKNRWFTFENCSYCLSEISNWLSYESLVRWTQAYSFPSAPATKSVGLVMAGNVPLVGFHDLLAVLISGHRAKVKMSSQDDVLLPYLTNLLLEVNHQWNKSFEYCDRLRDIEAVIATGSDNSSRYFEYYFKSMPRIIRKNRTSVGVIMGEEAEEEYEKLAEDVFTYFGMGCRNVSKLYIPENFDLKRLDKPFSKYQEVINHNKFANNYDYQRSIRLISSKPFHDTDFLIIEESQELVSPIAVLYYQYYSTQDELIQLLKDNQEKIQCIVSAKGWLKGSVAFGNAQRPSLHEYADGVDTLKFLLEL